MIQSNIQFQKMLRMPSIVLGIMILFKKHVILPINNW
jgi:hypothetical protein